MSFECDISRQIFVQDSGQDAVDLFENSKAIRYMHDGPPRFGHGSDMSVLIDGTQQEKEDYVWGLISTSIAIFSLFAFWNVVLLCFKFLGPSTVGYLSGRRVPLPAKPSDVNTQEYQDWEEMYQKTVRSNTCMKGVVIFAGLSIITCSILLSINGFKGLLETVETGLGTIDIVKGLLLGGVELIDRILANQAEQKLNVQQLLVDMNTICPAVRPELCTNLSHVPDSCNFENVFDGQVLKDTMTFFGNIRLDVTEQLLDVRGDLEEQIAVADSLDTSSDDFDWALYCAIAFSLALAFLCFCMVIGACFRLSRITRCFQNCILLPLFVLLVVLSWALSMAFVIGSMSLADFCVDAPDERLLRILAKHEDGFSPIVYAFIVFYISGCPATTVPDGIAQQFQFIKDSVARIEELYVLDNGFQDVLCGSQGATTAVALIARAISSTLCNTAQLLLEVKTFFACDNWFPLYENTVYEAMCFKGTDGFAWVTITQFIIVFMAMIILTFRIVFYGIEISDEVESDDDNLGKSPKAVPVVGSNMNDMSSSSSDDSSSEGDDDEEINNTSKPETSSERGQQPRGRREQPQSTPPLKTETKPSKPDDDEFSFGD